MEDAFWAAGGAPGGIHRTPRPRWFLLGIAPDGCSGIAGSCW